MSVWERVMQPYSLNKSLVQAGPCQELQRPISMPLHGARLGIQRGDVVLDWDSKCIDQVSHPQILLTIGYSFRSQKATFKQGGVPVGCSTN